MFREASRSAEGFSECRARGGQEAGGEICRQKCREKGSLRLAEEPGRMQE